MDELNIHLNLIAKTSALNKDFHLRSLLVIEYILRIKGHRVNFLLILIIHTTL